MTAPNQSDKTASSKPLKLLRGTKKLKPSFVTDSTGKKTGVLLTLKDWEYVTQHFGDVEQSQPLPPNHNRGTKKSLLDLVGIMDSRLLPPKRDKIADARERPEDEAARLDRR